MADEPVRDDSEGEDDAVHAERVPFRGLVRPDQNLPNRLLALPLNQRPVFPTMMLPLVVPEGRLAEAVRYAAEHMQGFVGFFLTRDPLEEGASYAFKDLFEVGCVARVLKASEHESGGLQILASVLARFVTEGVETEKPYVIVRGHYYHTKVDAADSRVRAYAMSIVTSLKELIQHNPVFEDEIKLVLANFNNMDGPGRLADLAATLTTAKREEIQDILETFEVIPRMEKVLALLAKETQLSQLKSRIQSQINQQISENQRKFFLNEQLKAIKEELGLETDEKSLDIQRFEERFAKLKERMGDEARGATEEELRKLALLEPASSEYGVSRNRVEWLLEVPWGAYTEDMLDLIRLREGLDRDHYGLDDIKARIVEFCAVRRLKNDRGGGIICLVGPPGTGKTSIGASIASNLGRRFFRFAVGGMRDEAEIRGHRRTYVGALPGKMVQALRRCGSMNPVVLIDEIDKLSRGLQGDPASALLEVLDPEQNKDFLDHYLDVRIDLSRVLFVCTANDMAGIPEPLLDRMEVIRLAGYIEDEKVAIATRYLIPKQRKAHGLGGADVAITNAAVRSMVRGYAREAGVRRLEQLLARICRQVATDKARAQSAEEADGAKGAKRRRKKAAPKAASFTKHQVGPKELVRYLGKPHMTDEELIDRATPGVVTGLAWTSLGGATLEVEAVAIPAKTGGCTLTGQLGEVMKESANLALSFLRANAAHYGTSAEWFDSHLIHVHVPAGATPKDGPSAGVTMATAMLSLALGKPVRRRLGMTGELTLTGRVYPIGGVREKIVAANRAKLNLVVLPQANERDYAELPEFLKTGLEVVFVRELDEVLHAAGLRGAVQARRGAAARGGGAAQAAAKRRPRA